MGQASIKNHIFKFDEITIGGNFEAIVYAYLNNTTLVINSLYPPFGFETFESREDLFFLKTNSKLELFDHLLFIMSLSGQVLTHSPVETIDINDKIIVISVENKLLQIEYNSLKIFDIEKIIGKEKDIRKNDKYTVVDWISVHSRLEHGLEVIKRNKTSFMKEIYFYHSKRHFPIKDLCVVSYLDEQDLYEDCYSGTYVKIFAERMFKKEGLSLKLQHDERNIRKPAMKGMMSFDEIIKNANKNSLFFYSHAINKKIILWKKRRLIDIHSI